jgi:AraC-like DNA-binding protein
MVCTRCKMVVKAELTNIGLHFSTIELGHAEIIEDISMEQYDQIRIALARSGLELMDDTKGVLVERIKKVIIDLIHYSEEPLAVNLSVYLSQQLHHNYTYMANVFSETQGHTIERFYIEHKIERVKELLIYNELNLTQIAFKMQYSSVAHLSAQFKKITGNTATYYKQLKEKRRSMLDDL